MTRNRKQTNVYSTQIFLGIIPLHTCFIFEFILWLVNLPMHYDCKCIVWQYIFYWKMKCKGFEYLILLLYSIKLHKKCRKNKFSTPTVSPFICKHREIDGLLPKLNMIISSSKDKTVTSIGSYQSAVPTRIS